MSFIAFLTGTQLSKHNFYFSRQRSNASKRDDDDDDNDKDEMEGPKLLQLEESVKGHVTSNLWHWQWLWCSLVLFTLFKFCFAVATDEDHHHVPVMTVTVTMMMMIMMIIGMSRICGRKPGCLKWRWKFLLMLCYAMPFQLYCASSRFSCLFCCLMVRWCGCMVA